MPSPSTHQDSPIERFQCRTSGGMLWHPNGSFVRFSDHRSLVEGLVEALEKIAALTVEKGDSAATAVEASQIALAALDQEASDG